MNMHIGSIQIQGGHTQKERRRKYIEGSYACSSCLFTFANFTYVDICTVTSLCAISTWRPDDSYSREHSNATLSTFYLQVRKRRSYNLFWVRNGICLPKNVFVPEDKKCSIARSRLPEECPLCHGKPYGFSRH